MNTEETKHAIKVMQAWLDGHTIEILMYLYGDPWWVETRTPEWNWTDCKYRIKPKAREFWLCNGIVFSSLKGATGYNDIQNGAFEVLHVREVIE